MRYSAWRRAGSRALRGSLGPHGGNARTVNARGATAAALVGQDHAKVAQRLLDPPVALGRERTRARAAGATLEKHNKWQVTANVLWRAEHAVEELDALADKGRVWPLGGTLHGEGGRLILLRAGKGCGAGAPPV